MTEPDRFRFLSFEVVRELFHEEMAWLRNNRYAVIEKYPDYLDLLSQGKLSHWHICQIGQQIKNEKTELAKKVEEEQRKIRNPASLTGSHRGD
jgi:hypothetical protein